MSDESNAAARGATSGAVAGARVCSLPTPCALLDAMGRVEYANSAWSACQNRRMPFAPPGRNLVEAIGALPSGEPAARGLREMLSGHRPEFTCDLCVDDANGAWVRLFASRDVSGSALVMLVDVTDRPSANSLAESEKRFQCIVESAMDGIVTIDEHERILMFNAAAAKVFGVPAAEALGSPLSRFLPQRARPEHSKHIREFGQTGVSSRTMGNLGTITGLRADGTEFAMEASISQATVGDQRLFTVILRDVSERRRLEAQLLQAQKMEGVGRLAGGIAHDFNNLLMAIFNYLTLASRRLGPDHPVSAPISQAQKAAERAADLTRQLLTFARKQVVSYRILCPREVAAGLAPMLRGLIGEDVTLRLVLEEDTGKVKADQSQLEQVLVNLAINARDAMPAGGTLTIESHNVMLDETYCRSRVDVNPGEHVVLAVTDTGQGMSAEVQARLFEPFFATKPAGKGTGLGLATSHGIIRQCGGHIAVYSELGRGTSVRVYLPRAAGDTEQRASKDMSRMAPGGTETVLLVEDSSLVRELVAEELRRAGYTVLTAATGPEALRTMESFGKPIHLLLTDVVMPEMSGVQLAEEVLRKQNVALIYMSGYTEETISHHGVDPSRRAFIAKPFMLDSLLHLMRRVLQQGPKGPAGQEPESESAPL